MPVFKFTDQIELLVEAENLEEAIARHSGAAFWSPDVVKGINPVWDSIRTQRVEVQEADGTFQPVDKPLRGGDI